MSEVTKRDVDEAVLRFKRKAVRVDMSKQTHVPEADPWTTFGTIVKGYNESAKRVESHKATNIDVSTVKRVKAHFDRSHDISRVEELEKEREDKLNGLYKRMYSITYSNTVTL